MKNKQILWIIMGVVLLLAIGAGIYFSRDTSQYTVQSGYTSLSISNVEILDSGSRIRIYGVANGAEALNVYFDPAKINQYINDDGYSSTKPAYMTIRMNDPTREFYVTKNTDKNFREVKTFSLSVLKHCGNNVPAGGFNIGRAGSLSGTCIYYVPIGTYSPFSGQNLDNTPVAFTIEGASGTLNPSSGNNVLTLSDGRTKVEWVGNLVNYQGLNTPSAYALLFTNSQYSKMIDSSAWNSYETAWTSLGTCLGVKISSTGNPILDLIFSLSDSGAKSCIDTYNNKINTALVDRTSSYKNSVNIDGLDFTNNGARVHLTTPTVFPTFIITLDASKVGIVELKGKPDIVSCVPSNTINSGDTYSTSVQVKNTGSNEGSFYGQLSCSGSSGVSGTISEQFVDAGQTVSMPVQVSGTNTVSGTQNNNCQVKIIDRKSQDSDTCTFGLGVAYQSNIVCTPNTKTCLNSNTLKICNSDGTNYNTENCVNGCIVLESGEGQCKASACPQGTNLCQDGSCKASCDEGTCKGHWYYLWIDKFICKFNEALMKFRYGIAIILGFLGGLLLGSFTYKFLSQDSKKKWIIFAIVTIVTGIIVGFIAFTYFWWIILALIILGIIKAFVPFL